MEMYKDSLISPDQLYPLIGRNIRRLRRQYNMTQEELAALIDGDQKVISKIESGKGRPGLSTYLRIANVFQVSIDRFLKGAIIMNSQAVDMGGFIQQTFGTAEKELAENLLNTIFQYLQVKE